MVIAKGLHHHKIQPSQLLIVHDFTCPHQRSSKFKKSCICSAANYASSESFSAVSTPPMPDLPRVLSSNVSVFARNVTENTCLSFLYLRHPGYSCHIRSCLSKHPTYLFCGYSCAFDLCTFPHLQAQLRSAPITVKHVIHKSLDIIVTHCVSIVWLPQIQSSQYAFTKTYKWQTHTFPPSQISEHLSIIDTDFPLDRRHPFLHYTFN